MNCPNCCQELCSDRANLDWHPEPVGCDMAELQVICHGCNKVAIRYKGKPVKAEDPDPDPDLEAAPGAEEVSPAPAALATGDPQTGPEDAHVGNPDPELEATPGAEEPAAASAAETDPGIPAPAGAEED